MKKFILTYKDSGTQIVEGINIKEACKKAGLSQGILFLLVAFEEIGGEKTEVVGQADCGCVGHAEDGTPCRHDLALLGLYEEPIQPMEEDCPPF